MRRLLLVLIVLIACVIALGYERGWFDVTTDKTGGQRHITISVDEDKIKADEKRALDQLPSMGKATTPAEPKKE